MKHFNKTEMKTKIILIFSALLLAGFTQVSGQVIRLALCIDSAIANKGNIIALRNDVEIAKLQISSVRSQYKPELSLSYNYRYNPVIPTQIIPLGQFSQIPTDEKRPIKFGTLWQQNSGLTLYQPLIDLSIKSRVTESRINEKLKNSDAAAAERDLSLEVIKTFANIWLKDEQLRSAGYDTLRTFTTKELVTARLKEGKAVKTDLNRAILNHNNALVSFRDVYSSMIREKIYLSFLTSLPLDSLVTGKFDFTPFSAGIPYEAYLNPLFDSIPLIKGLKLRTELLEQQEKTEKRKYTPVVGLEGFLGANQYTDTFNPFLAGSWYGSSYIGMSLRLQILSRDNTRNKVNRLKIEADGLKSRLQDERNNVSKNGLILADEIQQIKFQTGISEENIRLYEENISLNQERFAKGQINAYDLLSEEIDLQKEMSNLNEKKRELTFKQIEFINNSGALSDFINRLKD